jgi:hypothetical protein
MRWRGAIVGGPHDFPARLLLPHHSLFQGCPVFRGYADFLNDARRVFMILGIRALRLCGDLPKVASGRSRNNRLAHAQRTEGHELRRIWRASLD